MCAGCDSEQYIYKNIEGKKYCKSCTQKLQPPKSINKVSKKQMFKISIKQTQIQEDMLFYLNVWKERFYATLTNGDEIMTKSPRCENCSKKLGEEPNLMFFHHILEKRNFPKFRHLPENITILCPDCHSGYETYPDKFPKIQARRSELLFKLRN